MANLIETPGWEPGIYQIETTDPVEGGPAGVTNTPPRQLANRTAWLKQQIETLGTGKQPIDALLTALSAMVTSADKMPYFTGADAVAQTTLTAFARTVLAAVDAAAARAVLGAASPADVAAAVASLVDASPATLDTLNELAAALGDDANFAATMTAALGGKQPADATLTALAGLATVADRMIYTTGSDAFALTALTAFARTLLDDADAATARTTLGLGDVALKTMAADFASSLVANGYQKLPGGLIIQWGDFGDTSWAADTVRTITFPIAFPVACMGVVGITGNISPNSAFPTIPTTSPTGFATAFNTSGANTIRWLAVGR